ncbi:MAG: hypothetical protein IJ272_00780 [Clostridia bacterium]|nr:hypothetical protein [Clostridia bacterium]
MENITIGQILGGIAVITTLIGFGKLLASIIKTHYSDVIVDIKTHHKNDISDIKNRLTKLEEETKQQATEIQDSKEERLLLMRGVLACLNGLHEQGCNNTVTTTIKEFNDYLQRQAHK